MVGMRAGGLRAQATDGPAVIETAETTARLDRLTQLVGQVIGAPVALVTLVEPERQRFVGCAGLAEPWATTRATPLSHSFCRHVVAGGAPLVVADAREHALVQHNPAIDDLGVVAYLGLPLALPATQGVGVLCAIDHQPRVWQQAEIALLADFARLAETEFALSAAMSATVQAQQEKERILSSIADAFYLLDREERIEYVNPEAARYFGIVSSVVHGRPFWELCPPETRAIFEPHFRRVAEEGLPVSFEHRSRLIGRWFCVHVYPHGDGLGVFFRDITAQKDAEAATRESAANFTSLFQHTLEGMFIHDGRQVLAVNPALLAMLGYTEEEVLGRDPLEFIAPAFRPLALASLRRPSVGPFELLLLRRDGATTPVEVLGNDILDRGQPRRLVSVRDLRRYKQAEARLAASEQRYRSLFEHNPLPVYWIDPTGRVHSANRAAQTLPGQHSCPAGQPFRSLIALKDQPAVEAALAHVLSGAPELLEATLTGAGGETVRAELTLLPIVVDEMTVGAFAIADDVTAQRRSERELRFQKALLEAQREASPDSIMVVSPEREIIAYNQRFLDLWAMGAEPVAGQPFAAVWPYLSARLADPEGWFAESRRYYEDLLATGHGTLACADGREIEYHTAPVIAPDGQYYGRVWYHRDVTEQARAGAAVREAEERYRSLVEQIPAVTYIDASDSGSAGAPLYLSPQVETMLGYPLERWLTEPWFWRGRIHPDDRGRVVEAVESARRSETRFSQEYRLVAADGRVVWVQEDATPIRDAHGTLHSWQGLMFDISARKASEDELRRQALTFASISDGVVILDERGRITDWNPAAERIFGYSRAEVLGQGFDSLAPALLLVEDIARIEEAVEVSGSWSGELTMSGKAGSTIICEAVIRALVDDQGRRIATIGVHHDITERKELEEALLHQAFHDPLTNLPNRALLFDRISHALELAGRRQGWPAVLFLDLDNFKVVNDSLGHDVGDQLLVAAAQRIRSCLRAGDTVARLGGDEFAVLLEEADREVSTEIACRIIGAIGEPLQVPAGAGGHELTISTSIGIVLADGDAGDCADLLRRADVALYRAKRLGKARYAIFDSSMNAEALVRLELERDLRQAVDAHALDLAFQPITELASGRICGVEALARWTHPARGPIPPSEFIPIAEECGLILALGQEVLRAGCCQVRAWQASIPGLGELTLSVNLSARQFRHPGLVDDIRAALDESALDPRSLKLEITESLMMEDVEEALETIAQLKELGIEIAVDDFGTGYSSLAYLKRFPVDILKIDRSFVSGLEENLEDQVLVSAVLATARALGLTVTAEGVETDAQLSRLRALGCHRAQGYLLARPAPARAIETTLRMGVAGPAGVGQTQAQ